ncbi:MAG: hypothetical protein GY856_47320, partial [bacterium]|nr:hypothetical protein [bacterium]
MAFERHAVDQGAGGMYPQGRPYGARRFTTRPYGARRFTTRDTLVLDPRRPPDGYADNHWSESRETWLQWTQHYVGHRRPPIEQLAHLFTERPVYRPEEPVHIKGYLRQRVQGKLTPITWEGYLVVDGPGDLEWRYPFEPTDAGSVYHLFDEEKLPTGIYRAYLEIPDAGRIGAVSFRKEAYRLPRFEVQLHGPDRPSLDEAFE